MNNNMTFSLTSQAILCTVLTMHMQTAIIKIFVVRPSVCDGCGHGHNKFAGRVQNYHMRFSFHRIRNGHNLL